MVDNNDKLSSNKSRNQSPMASFDDFWSDGAKNDWNVKDLHPERGPFILNRWRSGSFSLIINAKLLLGKSFNTFP